MTATFAGIVVGDQKVCTTGEPKIEIRKSKLFGTPTIAQNFFGQMCREKILTHFCILLPSQDYPNNDFAIVSESNQQIGFGWQVQIV